MANTITDKQRFGALIYYYMREDLEADPTFTPNRRFGQNIHRPIRGESFPSPKETKALVKAYPRLDGMLKRLSPVRVELTDKAKKAFAALMAENNAWIRGQGGGKGSKVPDVLLRESPKAAVTPAKAKKAPIGGFGVGLELGALAMRCSNAARWVAALDQAEQAKMPLAQVIAGLRQALTLEGARGQH